MSAALFTLPFPVAFTSRGVGAPGAKAYFYQTSTLTPLPVYTTSALTTEGPNPATADGAGRFDAIYLDNTKTYRVIINDKTGAQLCDVDPYIPGQAPDASALSPYSDAAAASASAASASATSASTSASSASTDAASARAYLLSLTTLPTSGLGVTAASRAAMSILSTTTPAILGEGVRRGVYHFLTAADYATITGRTLATDIGIDNTTLDGFKGNIIIPVNSDYTGASGAWVYPYWAMDVSDRLFGATDGTDAKAALEAWGNVIWQIPCISATSTVTGSTAAGITIGVSGLNNPVTKRINFQPSINATAALTTVVTMQNLRDTHVHFKCRLFGDAASLVTGTAYANRLAGNGLNIVNAQKMTSTGEIRVFNFKNWGVVVNDNSPRISSYARLPLINRVACGLSKSAPAGYGLSTTWNTPVRAGSSGAINQTWSVKIPNTGIPAVDPLIGIGTWTATISGYPYSVSAIADNGDGTSTVTFREPWLPDSLMTAGSGTLDWSVGGGLFIGGQDANCITIEKMVGVYCGYAFYDTAAYGAYLEFSSDDGGTDIYYAFGNTTNGAHIGGGIGAGYLEGTNRIAQVLSLGATASTTKTIGPISGSGVDFTKWFKHGPIANAGSDTVHLYYQEMDEIVSVAGYEGKRIIAQNGPTVSATWDPPSVAAGSSTTTTLTVYGSRIAPGDLVRVAFNKSLQGLILSGYVSGSPTSVSATITVVLSNPTAGAVDLTSGTLTATLLR